MLHPDCPPGACPASQLNWKKILAPSGLCQDRGWTLSYCCLETCLSPTLSRDWNPGLHDSHQDEKITLTLSSHTPTLDVTEDTSWVGFFLPDEGDMIRAYKDEKTNTNKLCWCQLNVAMSPGNSLLKLLSPHFSICCTGTNIKSFNGIKTNHIQSIKWAY